MTTPLTGRVVRKVMTSRGERVVEVTGHGVRVRRPRQRAGLPLPVTWEALEDLGVKLAVEASGVKVPQARRKPRR